jgi:hypothetical protein
MTSVEDNADEAILNHELTEIRWPPFIKETLTDVMGARSRSADKDVTPKDSVEKEKASLFSDLKEL